MQIQVTENKSKGALRPFGNTVRVFVNRDFHYGYFVDEKLVVDLLTPEQQTDYLGSDKYIFDVSIEAAQKIIDSGATIYEKVKLVA